MKTRDLPLLPSGINWSNRILLISLLGIACLTLFPFEFHAAPIYATGRSPFLLGMSDKPFRSLDFFLNVLLFIPFGFGLSARVRERAGSRWTSFFLAMAAGAAVSYTVEFLQLYIPMRDSGWDDVYSNSLGSLVEFFLFQSWGGPIVAKLSRYEQLLQGWLLPRRAIFLLAVYFAAWFGLSVHLQNESRLSNWDPRCVLFVGNDASGEDPWKGQVYTLQIWNRAIPEKAIPAMVRREANDDLSAGMLASYDFSASPPFRDNRNFLPELTWASDPPHTSAVENSQLDGNSWLSSTVATQNLTLEIKKSNRFTVHIVCTPRENQRYARGHIVSLSQVDDNVNFSLRQEGNDLVFWFRNPLSETRSILTWYVPGALEAGKVRDIVASYDGSDAFLYLDGIRVPRNYRLSSGAAYAHMFSTIQTVALNGYTLVYEVLIFLPAGMLIGLAGRNWTGNQFLGQQMIALSMAAPAVLLEVLLARVSGRGILAGNIAYSLIFGLAGVMLVNSDRGSNPNISE